MSRTSIALFTLLGFFGASCCASKPKPDVAHSEHFTPAPPVEIPKPLTQAELEGTACGSSVNGPFAQVFTAEVAGMLSEMDLAIQRRFSSPANKYSTEGSVIVELRSCEAGKPSNDSLSLKFRGKVAVAALPVSTQLEGRMLRLNLNPYHITVAKGEQLAIVVLPNQPESEPKTDQYIPLHGVSGHSYPGGDFFRFEGGAWQPDHNLLQMQIRVLANLEPPTHGSTTRHAPLSTQPVNVQVLAPTELNSGKVIAQCLPHPRPINRRATRTVISGTWEFRTHIFNQDGSWYLEFTAFNGTNQQGSPFVRQQSPTSVSVARYGDPRGWVVYPPRSMENFGFINQSTAMPGPGEGWVRQFKLTDAKMLLAPGKYLVSVIMPREYSKDSITASFTIP